MPAQTSLIDSSEESSIVEGVRKIQGLNDGQDISIGSFGRFPTSTSRLDHVGYTMRISDGQDRVE